MAEFRQIHVQIWKDSWFINLNSDEKLLFIYLFGNERASVSGLYDLSIKVICFETDLDKEFIQDTLDKFQNDGKIMFDGGLIWVRNLRRYNASKSVKVLERIRRDLDQIQDCPIKRSYVEEWGIPPINQDSKRPPIPPKYPKREGRSPGSRSAQTMVRSRLIDERGEICEKCGAGPPIELHHKLPVRAGGSLDDTNCILLCISCHQKEDRENEKKYPISDSNIPYFENESDTDTETDTEQDTDTENENETESCADAPAVPTSWPEWQRQIESAVKTGNKNKILMSMYQTLYPDRAPPDWGKLGQVANKINGGREVLGYWLFKNSTDPPKGDILAYCMACANKKPGNNKSWLNPIDAAKRVIAEMEEEEKSGTSGGTPF